MGIICPKCNYERGGPSAVAETMCPRCGVVYAKAAAAAEQAEKLGIKPPTPTYQKSLSPVPFVHWSHDDLDTAPVRARGLRMLLIGCGVLIALVVLQENSDSKIYIGVGPLCAIQIVEGILQMTFGRKFFWGPE